MAAPEKTISEQFGIASRKDKRQGFSPRPGEQEDLLDMIRSNLITFALGSAGTGKTFCVMGAALEALERNEIEKIIIVRPAVSAGEELGFGKGSYYEKVAPYMMPAFDSLMKIAGSKKIIDLVDNGTIEVIPVAFMRGRNFDDAFIMVDEAQNNTVEQTEMLLTRPGKNSKIILCGDEKQNDLEKIGEISGLTDAIERFTPYVGVEPVAMKTLVNVVRGPIAALAVDAYANRKPVQKPKLVNQK